MTNEIYIKVEGDDSDLRFTLHTQTRQALSEQHPERELTRFVTMEGVDNTEESLSRIGGSVVEKLVGVGIGGLEPGTSAIFQFSTTKFYTLEAPIKGHTLFHYMMQDSHAQEPAKAFCNVQFDDLPVTLEESPPKIEFLKNLFETDTASTP